MNKWIAKGCVSLMHSWYTIHIPIFLRVSTGCWLEGVTERSRKKTKHLLTCRHEATLTGGPNCASRWPTHTSTRLTSTSVWFCTRLWNTLFRFSVWTLINNYVQTILKRGCDHTQGGWRIINGLVKNLKN